MAPAPAGGSGCGSSSACGSGSSCGCGSKPAPPAPRQFRRRLTLRITDVRILSQAFFFLLFLFLATVTWFSRLGGYPVSLFLEVDPLVALATALSTGTLYRNLVWSLWVLIPTLLLGRWFCNWMCPYGTLHQFIGWLFGKLTGKSMLDANRYRPLFRAKYVLLAFFLVMALFGSLQIGLLDPICLMYRSYATAFAPTYDTAMARAREAMPWLPEDLLASPGGKHSRIFGSSMLVGWMMLALLGMNLIVPRFFCRTLCPLGALLGTLSRFSLWRIDRDPNKCTNCDLCLMHCEGASDPHLLLRTSECFACMNCIEDCPDDALSFRFMPPKQASIEHVDTSRRRLVFGAVAAAFTTAFARFSGARGDRTFSPSVIRPPGSPAEAEFLDRCIKCEQCIRVCPTNVLQPALFQAGLEGFWTPVMDMRAGYCELNCTLCGQVCPTGAILPIPIEKKLGLPPFADQGPVKVGTAFVNRNRCLPWSMETPCVVCEEVCPTSPKAIGSYEEEVVRWDGQKVTLRKPFVRPELCIGCGI
ncbi:MAG: 4Fe-4S dicluster domain-containing protein, partial [Candidatus Wallbacteria bacterium]|nr:4Fe-4S dicluster domain-containing protein [Candidatus Wallbacteria bacterium]